MLRPLFVCLVVLLGGFSFADEIIFGQESEALVSGIDIDQWYSDVEHLASYNRYYKNPGIDEARDWLKSEFSSLGFSTHIEEFLIGSTKAYNVVAELKGVTRPDEIYLVGAHYDSISEQPQVLAPGAEDNASGTAGLLALARSIKKLPEATIRFIAFSGEEAGLYGSKAYVAALRRNGENAKVKGVYVMDMIGYSADDDLDVLIETSEANKPLVDLSLASHHRFCQGRLETTYNYWGSDHVPFIEDDYLTALIIENDYANYPAYHHSDDTVAHISKAMGREILKMIGGVLGHWIY